MTRFALRLRAVERKSRLHKQRVVPVILGVGDIERWRERILEAAARGWRLRIIRIVISSQADDIDQAKRQLEAHIEGQRGQASLVVYKSGTDEVLLDHSPSWPQWLIDAERKCNGQTSTHPSARG